MTLHRAIFAIALVLSLPVTLASPASAQQAIHATEADTKVEVSGVKDPALRPYRIMARGIDAFDKHHALAPHAALRFELKNQDGTRLQATGLGLRLVGETVDVTLPVDGDATFVLPRSQEAFDDNADLVVNRKKDAIRWRPHVRSPGVPENTRRLGDMRLECEVAWAVMRDEIGIIARTAMAAVGGMCHAPMTALYYRAPKQLAAVRLTSGERSRLLTMSADRHSYVVPVRNKELDDDSLVVYEFAAEAPATPAGAPAVAPGVAPAAAPAAAPVTAPQTTQGAAAP